MTGETTPAVQEWRERGDVRSLGGHDVFVVDVPGAPGAGGPPLFVLHGFPTCSFDWRLVVDRFAATRRVVLFDFVGFGLSAKPDHRYGIHGAADTATAVAADLGLTEVALVTHDMGDSVGGELLARDTEGRIGFDVTARVVTNGSIYLELATLTDGQNLLLSLDDAALPAGTLDGQSFQRGVANTFSPATTAPADELPSQWDLMHHLDGERLMPRTIRYIEDRRAEESRYTGAIETHPSPLGVVWGVDDPVARVAMVDRLSERRPEASVTRSR